MGGAALTYDARGNLTNPGGTPYTFNTRNQLYTDGTHLLYRGPGGLLGQEIWGPEQHAFDHARGQLATEFGYGNGGQFRRFVYGAGVDEPLVWYEGQGTTDRRWLHADERGSVVAISDASGTVTSVNTYDDYGVPGAGNVGRLQYTAQMWLPALGLYDYKARMYAPELGRFLQTDPIGYGDGMNWYGYVGGDPVNWSDPTGLRTVACPAGWSCDPRGGLIECLVPAICGDDIPVNGKRHGVDLPSRPEPLPRNLVEPTASAPQMVEEKCVYKNRSGQCVYDRDKNGKLKPTPESLRKACLDYNKMMKSNAQVGAVAGAVGLPGVANAGTGGAISLLSRISAGLGGPITTFIAGVTGAVSTVLGFASAPEGCK